MIVIVDEAGFFIKKYDFNNPCKANRSCGMLVEQGSHTANVEVIYKVQILKDVNRRMVALISDDDIGCISFVALNKVRKGEAVF